MPTRVQACVQTQATQQQRPTQLSGTAASRPSSELADICAPEVPSAAVLQGPGSSSLEIAAPREQTIVPGAGPRHAHQYDTAGGTRIAAVALDDYTPETTPRLLVPRDRKLYRYLCRFDRGAARNAENMDRGAVWREIQEWQARDTSRVALTDLGITDLTHLSPRQAMQVSTLITQDTLFYDRSLATDAGFSLAGLGRFFRVHAVLGWPAERFFGEGGATCREYSDVMHAVYQVLKERQHPDSSQLVNSYMKLPTTYDHVWNALYTVQANGEVMVTQVDPGWSDTGDAGRLGNIDYTFGSDNVRDYWRQLALFEGTGKRPLRDFLRRFEDRRLTHEHRPAREITTRSMRRAGGLQALARAFEALPEPLRLLALQRMQRRVQQQLIAERVARGLTTATEEPAQH